MKNIIILGSGPAGLTAAIYTARANLKPLLVSGITPGGQLTITTDVDNYPGFPEGVMGPELMNAFRAQAERFGTEFINGHVDKVDFSSPAFELSIDGARYTSKAVIVATGASARLLNIESETKFMGKGVSACATCDGFFYRDKEVVVVGGGDTAVEEAVFLTKFASRVTIIHRRDELRASKIMQEKAFKNPKIEFLWDSVVEEILGTDTDGVTAIKLKDIKTGSISDTPCHGVFIAIGHSPNTQIFKGQLEMDNNRYLITKNGTETNVKGVFAAGDVQDHKYRQAITAAGSGCMAAIDTERFLEG